MAKQIYIDENGNENLVSGTINTGKMLPMSTTEPTSMVADRIEACETAISGKQDTLTLSSGAVTWNTTNVTGGADLKYYQKYGRIVIAYLEFTPKTSRISNGNVICSGLPKPHSNYNCFGDNKQQMIIDNNGNLTWYFPTDTTTLNRWDLNIVYISAT